ncbi:uncharacterized protein LOC135937757 [Cloeon dipterum]|uniref:uncharacterized protein LOC135937757 n=1 Tax=Cloeon dipterum TaxID=197152 RepID=UPI00321FD7D0
MAILKMMMIFLCVLTGFGMVSSLEFYKTQGMTRCVANGDEKLDFVPSSVAARSTAIGQIALTNWRLSSILHTDVDLKAYSNSRLSNEMGLYKDDVELGWTSEMLMMKAATQESWLKVGRQTMHFGQDTTIWLMKSSGYWSVLGGETSKMRIRQDDDRVRFSGMRVSDAPLFVWYPFMPNTALNADADGVAFFEATDTIAAVGVESPTGLIWFENDVRLNKFHVWKGKSRLMVKERIHSFDSRVVVYTNIFKTENDLESGGQQAVGCRNSSTQTRNITTDCPCYACNVLLCVCRDCLPLYNIRESSHENDMFASIPSLENNSNFTEMIMENSTIATILSETTPTKVENSTTTTDLAEIDSMEKHNTTDFPILEMSTETITDSSSIVWEETLALETTTFTTLFTETTPHPLERSTEPITSMKAIVPPPLSTHSSTKIPNVTNAAKGEPNTTDLLILEMSTETITDSSSTVWEETLALETTTFSTLSMETTSRPLERSTEPVTSMKATVPPPLSTHSSSKIPNVTEVVKGHAIIANCENCSEENSSVASCCVSTNTSSDCVACDLVESSLTKEISCKNCSVNAKTDQNIERFDMHVEMVKKPPVLAKIDITNSTLTKHVQNDDLENIERFDVIIEMEQWPPVLSEIFVVGNDDRANASFVNTHFESKNDEKPPHSESLQELSPTTESKLFVGNDDRANASFVKKNDHFVNVHFESKNYEKPPLTESLQELSPMTESELFVGNDERANTSFVKKEHFINVHVKAKNDEKPQHTEPLRELSPTPESELFVGNDERANASFVKNDHFVYVHFESKNYEKPPLTESLQELSPMTESELFVGNDERANTSFVKNDHFVNVHVKEKNDDKISNTPPAEPLQGQSPTDSPLRGTTLTSSNDMTSTPPPVKMIDQQFKHLRGILIGVCLLLTVAFLLAFGFGVYQQLRKQTLAKRFVGDWDERGERFEADEIGGEGRELTDQNGQGSEEKVEQIEVVVQREAADVPLSDSEDESAPPSKKRRRSQRLARKRC